MNSVAQFITVLLIFIMVLAVTYLVTRWIGNFQKSQGMGSSIEVIETARISQNAYVQIVRIGQRYVALSVSKENVAYICDVPKEDIASDNGMNAAYDTGFGAILDKLRGKTDTTGDCEDMESRQDE